MISVALVSTWEERCGIAEYARNLVWNMPTCEVRWDVLGPGRWNSEEILQTNAQLVHVNYEAGLMAWLTLMDVQRWRLAGKRAVVTWHTSAAEGNRNPLHTLFDRVVMHERTAEGYPYIPMGIEIYNNHSFEGESPAENKLGTAGFPFPWKGFPEVVEAANLLGMGAMVIAPESRHFDTNVVEQICRERNPKVDYRKEWHSSMQVVDALAQCKVTMFAYQGTGNYGVSGAVRLGLASRRPTVVTRQNRQFRDLLEYEDEIEFANSSNVSDLVAATQRVLENGKKPKRILEDMGWPRVAQMYLDMYKELGG